MFYCLSFPMTSQKLLLIADQAGFFNALLNFVLMSDKGTAFPLVKLLHIKFSEVITTRPMGFSAS